MSTYYIKDLEELSGIKCHTIRVWELRFNLFNPSRDKAGLRIYTDDDLKKLLNVAYLNRNGFKISKIAQMSSEEIAQKVLEVMESEAGFDEHIESLIQAMIDIDEQKFHEILNKSIEKFGFETALTQVFYTFLHRTGILWQAGKIKPIQEHFISNLIRQKIITAIDNVVPATITTSKSFVLFLPENEPHELGLLFFYYLIKKAGHKVFYFGQNVPADDLKQIVTQLQPHYLVTSLTKGIDEDDLKNYVKNLGDTYENQIIYINGPQVSAIDFRIPSNVKLLRNASELRWVLNKL